MDVTPAIGRIGEGGLAAAAVVVAGAAVAVAVGAVALGAARAAAPSAGDRPRPARPGLADTPLAAAAGLALLVPLLQLLWWAGMPAAPALVGGAAALLGGGLVLAGRARDLRHRLSASPRAEPETPPTPAALATGDHQPPPGRALEPNPARRDDAAPGRLRLPWLPWLPAAVALGVFLWKLTRIPVWSWDHYAIWGVKARRMLPEGALDLAWATPGGVARPDYPLGLPLIWRALTFGAEPAPAAFVAAHALMAIALVALTGAAAARLSGWRLAGGAAAALVAASPLVWDTESLGLADLPLALWAVAAMAVVSAHLGPPGSPRPAPPLWIAGLCLGFLPWLKSEGLALALGLLAASTVALGVRGATLRRSLALWLPALLLGAAGLAATPGLGEREVGFFRGDWIGRGLAALPGAPRLAATLAADLAGTEWLGTWWLLPAASIAAVVLGARRGRAWLRSSPAAAALGLAAAIGLQLALYFATYLVSYIPAEQHAATSFHRIAAALAPLALLAAASALGAAEVPGGGSSAPGRRR